MQKCDFYDMANKIFATGKKWKSTKEWFLTHRGVQLKKILFRFLPFKVELG
jgi:hypothetical protein